MMSTYTKLFALALASLVACGDDAATSDSGPAQGRAVPADAFCAEMAALVCMANDACCNGLVPGGVVDAGAAMDGGGADGGTMDGGVVDGGIFDGGTVDGGVMDAVTMDGGAMDAVTMDAVTIDGGALAPPCVQQQREACERTVGALLQDGRTAYVPARGGAFLDAFATLANGCFVEPPEMSDFMSLFEGTGAADANCTPRSTSIADLRIAQLSCADGLTCHLYRRSDGTPSGVCEAREDLDCSHPLDCGPGLWCNLPADWEPGRWGVCQAPRTNDWDCASDFECESRYCAPTTATCTQAPEERYCAATGYEAVVAADGPVAYWRLGDADGLRASALIGEGLDGEYVGPNALTPGALHGDPDGALLLSGDDGAILPPGVGELLSEGVLSLELWFKRGADSLSTGPLLEFGVGEEIDLGVRIWNHDTPDKMYLNLGDVNGEGHRTFSAEGVIAADTWHHVVITYDGSVGRIYVDGAPVGEEIVGAFIPQTTGPLYVGFRQDDERRILGAVDEIAVYDRPLTAARIRAHTAVGHDGPAEQPFLLFRWLE